ncbi:adenosylmethionine--8-amino-7-oxononanoate transaminase [Psychrobacter sp. I-STPA10]|uniref:adenosylmethionine--8-amino-7-oxononanoate transaminase n=1 Tax=Psychrobacter sp. I-STPA10 TaxID=2585769 RepID=UPI001E32BD4C|nr:adenosylmethionine--8-amino-7-oxononanoate transaminase [Psychrobacter sp. I-STPA10]
MNQFDSQHLWHPYTSLPPAYPNIVIDHAEGVYLYTKDGRRMLDGMSSWWSAIHGYNHPKLNDAIHQQVNKMSHVMFGGLTHQPAIELGKKLLAIVPDKLDAIFYADSGSVSVEVALKMALQYQVANGKPNKKHFATTRSGYYGDTWHAMSVCDPVTGMHGLYGKQLPIQYFIDAPPMGFDQPLSADVKQNLSDFFAKYHQKLAAFIIEPIVQGAGGMRFYSPEYLQLLRKLCDDYDVLLITDEIATGFGRTGQLFACQHAQICPDIMTIGKALTGGYMTFAATLCTRHVADTISHSDTPALMHGPTFMGNPLACSVANASVDLILSNDIPAKARAMQSKLWQYLTVANELTAVKEVRCLGAIGVIELHQAIDMTKFSQLLAKTDIWVRPFGTLVYLMPPLITNDDELKHLCTTLIDLLIKYFNQ